MSIAMTMGPVAAAMKSRIVWSSRWPPANPRVSRLDPACLSESPRVLALIPYSMKP
ncbi:unannotated protein [freshwater metagenome]|uniref:Unannotated protein n=1 Tax=freshwater metagenome TaxID=449393 RepID=A0A6J7EUC3_9ZZZZ